jgi:hypothetical protein
MRTFNSEENTNSKGPLQSRPEHYQKRFFFLENGTESKLKSKLEKTSKKLSDKKENMTSTLLAIKKEEYLKEFP